MIAQIPTELQNLLTANPEEEAALWSWMSQLHYGQVVEQAGRDHELVRIKNRFDFKGD